MIISSTEIQHCRCNQTHTYCTLTAIIHFPFYGLMITGTHKIIQPGYYHPTLVQPSVYLYIWITTDKWYFYKYKTCESNVFADTSLDLYI